MVPCTIQFDGPIMEHEDAAWQVTWPGTSPHPSGRLFGGPCTFTQSNSTPVGGHCCVQVPQDVSGPPWQWHKAIQQVDRPRPAHSTNWQTNGRAERAKLPCLRNTHIRRGVCVYDVISAILPAKDQGQMGTFGATAWLVAQQRLGPLSACTGKPIRT